MSISADAAPEARPRAELERFFAEHEKLAGQREKLAAEREKLFYEALKTERERWWLPPVVVGAAAGTGAAVFVILTKLFGT